jgi:hypothetical protein
MYSEAGKDKSVQERKAYGRKAKVKRVLITGGCN